MDVKFENEKKEDPNVDKLVALSCYYHYKVQSDGKCYSTTCGMNTDKDVKEKIAKNGCSIFERMQLVKDKREKEGEREN